MRVRISGGSYGTTYAVAECDPKAVLLLPEPSSSLQDGCDSRNSTVVTVGADGSASVSVDLAAVLTTSLGAADCRTQKCFLAIFALHSTGGGPFAVQGLSSRQKPVRLRVRASPRPMPGPVPRASTLRRQANCGGPAANEHRRQ